MGFAVVLWLAGRAKRVMSEGRDLALEYQYVFAAVSRSGALNLWRLSPCFVKLLEILDIPPGEVAPEASKVV